MSDTNIIELNGKRYDALTGKMLGVATASFAATEAGAHKAQASGVIDDFVHHRKAMPPVASSKASSSPQRPAASGHSVKTGRQRAPGLPAHHPQHSKTLMRRSVKQPAQPTSTHPRVNVPAGSLPTVNGRYIARPTGSVNADRLHRAGAAPKSPSVQHFSKQHQQLQSHPVPRPKPAIAPAAAVIPTTRLQSLIDDGLAHATSHEALRLPKEKLGNRFKRFFRPKPRLLTVAVVSLMAVGIVAFLGYINRANLDVRLAAARSGVAASLPTYQPSGFSFRGPITYSNGQVTITYQSTNDQRHFSLVEQSSNWDSQTLRDNLSASYNSSFQTLEDNGHSLYIYGQGNATWVNSGVWYQVTGNANLSDQQLLALAGSL